MSDRLKYAVDDTRPNGGRRSFPSGHTAWAFTGAAFIHHRYGWEWGVPTEIAAAAVAISRIDGNYHRWRDVIASAAIAHASAYFLVSLRFFKFATSCIGSLCSRSALKDGPALWWCYGWSEEQSSFLSE